jgi:aliphatic nitrilase
MRNRVSVDSQSFAQMSKAFVISACGTVDEDMIRKLELSPEQETIVRDRQYSGGSVIVAPNLRIIAGPMGADEGILYADCDLEIGIKMKLRHDFAGHYNRPDIFQLHVNRAAPQIYTIHNAPERPALPDAHIEVLDAIPWPSALLESPDAAAGSADTSAARAVEGKRAGKRIR